MPIASHAAKAVTSASVALKVIRANGTVEDLGVVAYTHRNPVNVLRWRLSRWFRRMSDLLLPKDLK